MKIKNNSYYSSTEKSTIEDKVIVVSRFQLKYLLMVVVIIE